MKKICILFLFALNLLPMIENGKFTFVTSQLQAQMYGAEYTCEDGQGGYAPSSIPCDEGPCVTACSTCKESYPCDGTHQCPGVSHNGEGLPDNGSGSGGSGSGSSGGGGSGSSGGGSGSSGEGSGSVVVVPGGGSGGVISPPYTFFYKNTTNIAVVKNFHGYDLSHDCFKSCKEIMTRHGQTNLGGYVKAFQLMDKNGTYYAKSEKVFNEIARHLKANKYIIAGIDHTPGSLAGNGDGESDHFVVISGAGYDKSRNKYYISFIETGRYQASAEDACDPNKNRLYYDRNKGFEGRKYNNKATFKLTHVKPNF